MLSHHFGTRVLFFFLPPTVTHEGTLRKHCTNFKKNTHYSYLQLLYTTNTRVRHVKGTKMHTGEESGGEEKTGEIHIVNKLIELMVLRYHYSAD